MREYTTPALIVLGDFRSMTQAGGTRQASDGFSIFAASDQPDVARS